MSAADEGTSDDEASVAKKTRTGNQSLDVALMVITASSASGLRTCPNHEGRTLMKSENNAAQRAESRAK
jgi:hypothetical protein